MQGKGEGLNTLCLPSPCSTSPALQPPPPKPLPVPHSPATSPANQPHGPGPEAVHEDPQRQGGGTEHEGADGEAQVEHLFLLVTAQPRGLRILAGVGGVLS